MQYVCMVCDVLSQGPLEPVEYFGEDGSHVFHALVCDQLYITRRLAERSNLDHDRLSMQHMRHFPEFLSALVDVHIHAHMYCSAFQLKTL